MQLSPRFALHEFLSSQTAARMGRVLDPPPEVIDNLRHLCVSLLEPIRVLLGRPIVITSGWRPGWLNTAIGGSLTSDHQFGWCADTKVVGMTNGTFAKWIQHNAPLQGWKFDQVILEFPPNGWVHISASPKARNQYLTATSVNGKTVYTQGIHG